MTRITWAHTMVKTKSGIQPGEREGAKAYDAGVPLLSNPHPVNTAAYERWAQGWVQAATEDLIL